MDATVNVCAYAFNVQNLQCSMRNEEFNVQILIKVTYNLTLFCDTMYFCQRFQQSNLQFIDNNVFTKNLAMQQKQY